MKNVIVYTGNFCIKNMNAAGKRVFSNSILLNNLGYKVVLISVDCCESKFPIESKDFLIYSYPKEFYQKKRYNYNLFYNYFESIVEKYKNDICAVICYGSPSLCFFNVKILNFAKKNNISFINDVVDWLSVESKSLFFKTIKYLDTFVKNYYINRKSDGIIAISSWFQRYYKDVANCIVIPPLTTEQSCCITENKISQIAYGGIPFRIGEIVKKKGNMKDRFDFVINLLSKSKKNGAKFVFHVIGFTKQDLLYSLPMLQNDVDYLGDNILFYGKLSMQETQNILKKMDYTILLRENNRCSNAGFSTKIAESISMGIPVITTKTSDVEKYLPEGYGAYFLNMYDEVNATKKIISLTNKPASERLYDKKTCSLNRSFDICSYKDEMKVFIEKCVNHV